jgi:putative transposase
VKLERALPKALFCDNGSEFTSQAMDLWVYRNGVKIDFSRPGKRTDNTFVASFNGTFRSECRTPSAAARMNKNRNAVSRQA